MPPCFFQTAQKEQSSILCVPGLVAAMQNVLMRKRKKGIVVRKTVYIDGCFWRVRCQT